MTTLVTGANGFVGSALCARLHSDGTEVRGAVRSLSSLPDGVEAIAMGGLLAETDWTVALRSVDQVVHLAARVHVMNDKSTDPLAEFRQVNVEGTANLARQAAASGVCRFVYLSSIKVNGESTEVGQPFTADDVPAPEDFYGVSKYEAELALRQIADETGMEVVIIRPPLVYGPSVKANFESMMRWLLRGVPLPLAAVTQNRRSLVALDNLVDLIMTCLSHPAAVNQTFLVSDGEDLSTAGLLGRMGAALDKPARLLYMPTSILKLGAQFVNKPGIYQRLCGSLQLDIAKTRQLLAWTPPVSVDEGLRRAAEGFRA
jgi:nucleoside-diphosphate-sugar epimerase